MKTSIDLQTAIKANFQTVHEECIIKIEELNVLIKEEENQSNIDVMYSKVNALRTYSKLLYDAVTIRLD